MSSDDRIPHPGTLHAQKMRGLAFLVGSLALVVSAGCGEGTTTTSENSGGGGGPVAASISGNIAVGTRPSAIAVDSTTNKIYVADFGNPPPQTQFLNCPPAGGDVTVIDGASESLTVVSIQPGGGVDIDPVAIALNWTSHEAYVLAQGWGYLPSNFEGCFQNLSLILAIDTSTLTPTGFVFALPPSEGFSFSGITVDQSTGEIYVGYIAFIDPNVLVISGGGYSTIPVSAQPGAVAVNERANKIYVTVGNSIAVIDSATNAVVATITDPNAVAPAAVAVNPTTNTIYVANSKSNNVTVIDGATGSLTATIPVGASPSGLDVDSQANFIYVANAGNSQPGDPGNVTVIDGATHVTTTLTDFKAVSPIAVAVNSVTNKIYVANSGSNSVTVIDGAHK
ncbi:MAG TPA: hypothetical protein VFO46_09005 [Candidatus Sulfotelmatobacter sp.]|nr:hypothetical protein [Candidatus Sulfotelmatobacter sp.]